MSADDATASIRQAVAPIDERLQGFDWYPIAKKEFADTIRSRALVILAVVFAVLFVVPPIIALYTDFGSARSLSALLIAGRLRIMSVVVPIAAIALGYAAISGERESGSMKLLLSLPYDRLDVVIGKFVGRSAVLLVPLVGALVLQYAVVLPELAGSNPGVEAESILAFVALTMLLGVVFLGAAIGISAGTSTTRRSLAVVGGLWIYFFALWNSAARGTGSLLREYTDVESMTTIKAELAVKLLNPTQAYQTLTRSLSGNAEHAARAQMFSGLRSQVVAQQLQNDVPFYLSDGAALAVLLFWMLVPLYLGYQVFERSDL